MSLDSKNDVESSSPSEYPSSSSRWLRHSALALKSPLICALLSSGSDRCGRADCTWTVPQQPKEQICKVRQLELAFIEFDMEPVLGPYLARFPLQHLEKQPTDLDVISSIV
ncbi:hypothetical protein MY11210_009040 [Beauveria gryllotalpidicola]